MLRWTVHLEGGPRRVNHAAVSVGHRVYSFGGYCSGEDYETLRQIDVHVFNAVSLRWTKLPPMRAGGQAGEVPYMRYGHSAVLIDDTVYLWGGRNDTEGACNVLYGFDINTHKWFTPKVSGTVPGARDGHSACVLGKNMYVFGGYEQLADCFSNDIHKLDTSSMTWTLISAKGTPARWRDFHSATMLGSRMYVFGGRADRFGPFHSNNEIYCNRIRIFDTRAEAWLECPPTPLLPEGRRSHSAFGYNGELYIFGGYNARLNRHFHDLWKFNPVSFSWKKIEPKGKGPCPRRRQCCCIVGDKIVLFGGTSPSPEEGLGDEFDLMDHSDLHILDFNLAAMSFEELLELQSRVGTKMYRQLVAETRPEHQPRKAAPTRDRGPAEKQRPLEMSSKTRVPFLRQVVPVRKKVARDPRFDDLSGEYNPEVFEKTYRFLNEYRAKEKELVAKHLKKSKPGEEQEKLKQLLFRMDQQEAAQQEKKRQQEQRLALKQEQRAQARQGHRPYFLKKSEQRQLALAEKYKKLKRSQKLESFLSRKRRRNAGKDRRRLPLGKD
ncbi:LOW QUALITY PROTEIN: kelch domain-containing protein 3-like [Phascolarctos cinereus]|uniref:rRNA biogenesis protein RRP36 n=1 Tax=Phascolarctos cinereus TaxID=38626 RepID=A0A6P5JMQ2_PHACI|nr:LOW QUALITY PROTEIN: kelch domain-containing protein 3-like [Phascolarctos cinereus]